MAEAGTGGRAMNAQSSARRSTRRATVRHGNWYKLKSGDYVMTTWSGETQLTYRARRREHGWELASAVAGRGLTRIGEVHTALRDAQAAAEVDAQQGV